MSVLFLFYIIGVIVFARKIADQLVQVQDDRLIKIEQELVELKQQREDFFNEKIKLEEQALEIFALFEITKEITKALKEEDAVNIFVSKLREYVRFEQCEYFDTDSDKIKELKKMKECFIFNLQGKRKRIGYLAIRGLPEQDKEKFMILGHQFALALRRVKLYEEIEKIAITDSLTEVYTRRYVLERLSEELHRSLERKIKMSFLMIDVDHFKRFNDQYGHLTGDRVLSEIGVIIKQNIREIDIAGRYGGEEFCVVLPDTDNAGAQYAAERIRQAAAAAVIKAYDAKLKITLSCGIATCPEHGKEVSEIVDKADWALYRAKKMGRNRICSFGVYKDE